MNMMEIHDTEICESEEVSWLGNITVPTNQNGKIEHLGQSVETLKKKKNFLKNFK